MSTSRRNLLKSAAAGTLGVLGGRDGRTPNLDRLACQGVVFENSFSNKPVWVPSRKSMWTSLYPHQHGSLINRGGDFLELTNTVLGHFKERGYRHEEGNRLDRHVERPRSRTVSGVRRLGAALHGALRVHQPLYVARHAAARGRRAAECCLRFETNLWSDEPEIQAKASCHLMEVAQ